MEPSAGSRIDYAVHEWIEDYAMSVREDYRQYACDCLRLADNVKDRAEREILLEMADEWTVIAFQAPLLVEHTPDRPRTKILSLG